MWLHVFLYMHACRQTDIHTYLCIYIYTWLKPDRGAKFKLARNVQNGFSLFFRGLEHVSSTLDLSVHGSTFATLGPADVVFVFFNWWLRTLGVFVGSPQSVPNPVISRVSGINPVIAGVTHVRTGVNYWILHPVLTHTCGLLGLASWLCDDWPQIVPCCWEIGESVVDEVAL